MRLKSAKPIRRILFKVHDTRIRFQDRFGAWAEAILVLAIGVIFLAIYHRIGIVDADDWASIGTIFVATAIIVYIMRRAANRDAILIEITTSYLLRGGKPFLDSLLGKLISGTWRRELLKPGDALFDVLKQISEGEDWAMKRRIAEALPALGSIDPKRALEIIQVLRDDWEPTRWKTDLRRRVVEALVIPAAPGYSPLIDTIKPRELIPLLQLREKDQVYVAMAITEASYEWEDTQPKKGPELRNDLLNFMSVTFPKDESESVSALMDLLQLSKRKEMTATLAKLEEMSNSPNTYIRIACSRNVLILSERFPEKTLDLMLKFLETSQPNNVRRPIAKERSVDFLISIARSQAYRQKAHEVLWKLFSDPDSIISETAFDKAESLKEKDKELLISICDFVLGRDTSQELLDRVKRLKQELVTGDDR